MTGMESMFLGILKAMGFNPQETAGQIQAFATNLQNTLSEVDAKFTRVESKLDRALDKLETISPSVPYPSSAVDETMSAVVVPLTVTFQPLEQDAA